jgi:hypothetical protein
MTLQTERMARDIGWVHRRIIRYGDGDNVEWWQVPSWENFEALIREAPTQRQKQKIRRSYENWVKALTPEQYRILVEGKGGWITGAVYPEFDARIHASYDKASPQELVELARQGRGRIVCGLDQGSTQLHPTAMVWWFVSARSIPSLELAEDDCIQYREYRVGSRRVDQNIARQKAFTGDEPISRIYCDPHMDEKDPRGGPTILQMYIKAWKPTPVTKANNAHDIGHAMMRKLLAPRKGYPHWPQYRICKGTGRQTTEEFYSYNAETKVGDDLMDCVRYVAVSRPRAKPLRQPGRIPCDPRTGVPLTTYLEVQRYALR